MKTNISLIIIGLVLLIVCIFIPSLIGLNSAVIGTIILGYFNGVAILIPEPFTHGAKNRLGYYSIMIPSVAIIAILLLLLFLIAQRIFNQTFIITNSPINNAVYFMLGYLIGLGFEKYVFHKKKMEKISKLSV